MMKKFYSVELEGTMWEDDTFTGTYDECVEYIKENEYTNDEARIAYILVDEDGCMAECLDIITEW